MAAIDAVREALRPRALGVGRSATAIVAARAVADQGGPAVRAVIFFGSRKTQARPDAWSAWDFFVLVDRYRDVYRSLKNAGALRHGASLLAAVSAAMPPSSIALRAPDAQGGPPLLLKCQVVTMEAYRRETSQGRHDHFLLGRLFQPAEIVYAADPAAAAEALEGLARACVLTFCWVKPSLPPRFDVALYCRTLLRVSFAGEIRPEPAGRAEALWSAQQDALRPVYSALLSELLAAGELAEAEPGLYALARPVTRAERLRLAAYFRWSLVRATARWAKHIVTFEGWLDLLVRKARRHTGQDIVLTPRERRLPLVFLWPRVIRYLRDKDAGERRP